MLLYWWYALEKSATSKEIPVNMLSSTVNVCEHSFISRFLNADSTVLDLGANHGEFSHGIIQRFGCRVASAEPLSELCGNISPHPRLQLFNIAVGGKNQTIEMNVFSDRCASVLGPITTQESMKTHTVPMVTLAELRKHPPQTGYVVSSFLPEVLTTIHELDPAIPLGFLCETEAQLRGWRQMPAEWVIPPFELADRELIELVHTAGKRIMVWTVNRAERMREFAAWGVGAIISDETELLVRSLR